MSSPLPSTSGLGSRGSKVSQHTQVGLAPCTSMQMDARSGEKQRRQPSPPCLSFLPASMALQ
jgi:hypothetical protein